MRITPLFLVFTLTACGGSLKYTINESAMSGTTTDDRAAIQAARDEHSRAEDAVRQAKAEEQKADHELAIANNDYKTAKLTKDSANTQRKLAEGSGDVNNKNKAERSYTAADKAKDAADARVTWLEKKYKYAKANREASEALEHATNAKIEMEKAKLCQAKGIKPSEKFSSLEFEQQSVQSQTKYNDKRKDVDELRIKMDEAERRYNIQKQDAEAAKAVAQ